MNGEHNNHEDYSEERDDQLGLREEPGREPADSKVRAEHAAPAEGVEQTVEPSGEERAPEQEEIEKYRQEAEEYKDRWLRAVAELDNFRKRAAREREELIRYGNENVLREMIVIVDNLERAFNHANESVNSESIIEGIKRIVDQFSVALKKFGVEPINATGAPFDPHLHEAVMQVESSELQPNTVAEEFEKGYLLSDRLLRPAKVSVVKAPDVVEQ